MVAASFDGRPTAKSATRSRDETVTIWAREFVEMAAISSQFVRPPNLEEGRKEGKGPNKQITELRRLPDGRNSNSSRAKSDGSSSSSGGWRNNGQSRGSIQLTNRNFNRLFNRVFNRVLLALWL